MKELCIGYGLCIGFCFLLAWVIRPRRHYRVTVRRFIPDSVEDGVCCDTFVELEPLIWYTSLPYREIRKHLPPIGAHIGEGIYAGVWQIDQV